ncbi:MAG: outer membrane protein transport protein [Paludisphaera borealis]|uniref:OmpP1/FadL family transporter n=1 Tax=Paludisphaera borealis TaxID=1387353 RepID=UPI00283BFB48|nr:outer membrane protein transport protein [Paludisphaera borealis]MDR3619163.1 outer membrane protein transport protein [Paludisphaera borealis]
MRTFRCSLIAVLLGLSASSTASAQGIFAPSAGPINSAMAGASVAAPVDFGGSYWNPAILSGLKRPEALISTALAIPSIHLASELQANSIGGAFPPTNRFGTARSDSGVSSGLAVGASFKLKEDSPLTLGLGIFGLVGGGVNFAGSYSTPVLGPRQPPNNFGLGPIYANMSILSVNPMASLQVTDKLAVAGGPVVTAGTISFSPAFFAAGPKDQYGVATFPTGTNGRPFWGGGFQLGLLYELNDDWNLGFSYKSPVWQERWAYNSFNPNLSPRRIGVQAQLPEVISWGVAYKGLPKTLIDVDLRYFDYANASLFGQKIADGGLDWRSVFAVATGVQYKATDRLSLMGGYLFNTNPVRSPQTLFNAQAPAIIQHMLSMGVSYRMTDDVAFSLAWQHGFRNAIEGPIGQVPGGSIRLDAQVDVIYTGLTIQYGGKKVATPQPAPTPPAPAAVANAGSDE